MLTAIDVLSYVGRRTAPNAIVLYCIVSGEKEERSDTVPVEMSPDVDSVKTASASEMRAVRRCMTYETDAYGIRVTQWRRNGDRVAFA